MPSEIAQRAAKVQAEGLVAVAKEGKALYDRIKALDIPEGFRIYQLDGGFLIIEHEESRKSVVNIILKARYKPKFYTAKEFSLSLGINPGYYISGEFGHRTYKTRKDGTINYEKAMEGVMEMIEYFRVNMKRGKFMKYLSDRDKAI